MHTRIDPRTLEESGFQIDNKETRESVLSVLTSRSIRISDVVGERNENSELDGHRREKSGPANGSSIVPPRVFYGIARLIKLAVLPPPSSRFPRSRADHRRGIRPPRKSRRNY
jgi:hypothetical protein